MIIKKEKKQKNNYYRRIKMARSQNEKDRDSQIVNALDAILKELAKINTSLNDLTPSKKGR